MLVSLNKCDEDVMYFNLMEIQLRASFNLRRKWSTFQENSLNGYPSKSSYELDVLTLPLELL